jgi:hypothetical protein
MIMKSELCCRLYSICTVHTVTVERSLIKFTTYKHRPKVHIFHVKVHLQNATYQLYTILILAYVFEINAFKNVTFQISP